MGRELPQGRRIGKYTVERLLGRGGVYALYEARDESSERLCALQVFYLDPESEPWGRFRREIEQLQLLQHPSQIEVLEVGMTEEEGAPYLVTERLKGETLASRLRTRGALTLPQTLAVARQIGAALYAGHGVGVLHRDVRPDNILIVEEPVGAPSGDESSRPDEPAFERVKLLNVGVGRLIEGTMSWMGLVGDPDYLAPEQITGHRFDVDPRSDQYSLAIVLYQSLTTSRPFHGDSVGGTLLQVVRGGAEPLRLLRSAIPENVDAAIARAMSRDRELRYPDLNEFLQSIQEGVPLPLGMAELTEPWLSPASDEEEAKRLVLAVGAAPAAPLSIGVSAALARSGPVRAAGGGAASGGGVVDAGGGASRDGSAPVITPGELAGLPQAGRGIESGRYAIPQPLDDTATLPHSMENVVAAAVVEAAPRSVKVERSIEEFSGPLEIIAEPADGRPEPQAGETEVLLRPSQHERQLPSIIVDLPTRSLGDDKASPRRTSPTDPTKVSLRSARAALPGLLARLAEQMDRRASLAERIGWALAGAGLGGLLMRLLS